MGTPPSSWATRVGCSWAPRPTCWNDVGHPTAGRTSQPGDVVRGGVALDRDGRRLAAVVEDTGGISRIATFVRAGEAWEPDVRLAALPGSFGGRLAWLP